MIIICDLDGTLSNCTHRQHFAIAKDWDGFHACMMDDRPINHTQQFLQMCASFGWPIVFLTGRPDVLRAETTTWLEETADLEFGVDWYDLLMRPRGDYTPDYLLKISVMKDSMKDPNSPLGKMVCDLIDRTEEDIKFEDLVEREWDFIKSNVIVLDDRDGVTENMRNDGWTCWQVSQGVW